MCARADRERAANRLVRKPDRKARKITAMLVRLAFLRTNFDLNVGHVGIRDSATLKTRIGRIEPSRVQGWANRVPRLIPTHRVVI